MLAEHPVSIPAATLVTILAWQIARRVYEYVTQLQGAPIIDFDGRLPFVGHTFAVLKNAHRFYDWTVQNAERAGGRPVRWQMLGRPAVVVLTTPALVEDVQKTQFECFEKGEYMREVMRDILGAGIVTADGADWVHQRKTSSNLFTTRMLRESMSSSVHALLQTLHEILLLSKQQREPVDLTVLFSRFTMDAFAEIAFGVKLESLRSSEEHAFQSAFDNASQGLIRRLIRPNWFWKLQRWLNVGCEGVMAQDVRVINETVLEIISTSLRQRQSSSRSDTRHKKNIVSLFLDQHLRQQAETGDKEPFNPTLLRDIVVAFLVAGRDTTSVALTWFFYALDKHPDVERKIRAELASKLPELMIDGSLLAPSMGQLQDLPYLEAAIKESLRLYPTVPSNIRQAKQDVVLSDGTFIKKGTTVNFSSYTLARMPWVWGPDAKQYKPERWLDADTGKLHVVSPFKFNAFLAGPRVCLGMNMAMAQMKMVAASVLSRFHLAIEPDQDLTYAVQPTLRFKDGLRVQVVPAAAWA